MLFLVSLIVGSCNSKEPKEDLVDKVNKNSLGIYAKDSILNDTGNVKVGNLAGRWCWKLKIRLMLLLIVFNKETKNLTTSDFGLGVILFDAEVLVAYKQTKNPKPFFL